MSFDIDALNQHIQSHGRIVRVVIADIKGSSPREIGASMLVWEGGQSGTIGGGALEYQASKTARTLTVNALTRHPLGPSLGQCCGGSVTLLSEVYTPQHRPEPTANIIARGVGDMPLGVSRLLAKTRSQGTPITAQLVDTWMIEPVSQPSRTIWIWGAGHVGRAIVNVLTPLPDFEVTWVDTAFDRFPDVIPKGINILPTSDPITVIQHAPANAEHFILTYSHEIDLNICHNLLLHNFAFVGLIGSTTKWARFRTRLAKLGHDANAIAKITCPIGNPTLGKHPHAIAIGIVSDLLTPKAVQSVRKERA